MEQLYELAYHIKEDKHIVEAILPKDPQSPLRKLCHLVFTNQNLSDAEVMWEVYGKKNSSAFSRLKSRFKEVLIKTVLLQSINTESEDSRINESYNQYRSAIAAKILKDLKGDRLSVELAERSILKAIKYHSTENVILLSRILVKNYMERDNNRYKLKKWLAIQEKYLKIYEWEVKSENYFFDLQKMHSKSLASASKATIEKAEFYLKELEKINDIKSFIFNYNKYRIKIAIYEYYKNYQGMIEVANKAIKDFSAPEIRSAVLMRNFNNRKIYAFIQGARYSEAIELGELQLGKQQPGSLGWYINGHYTLKAYLYGGQFEKASKLIVKLIQHPKYPKLNDSMREIFFTTLGYMHLLHETFPEKFSSSNQLPDFKLYKFLNEIPIFSKDKAGINVSIIILHIAFMLNRKDYVKIIDKIDSLNQYAHRYLRKDEAFRSNVMIKLIIEMAKADFNITRTERYTTDLEKKLSMVKLEGSGENIETEIIPYELLWEIMKRSIKS